MQQIQGEWAIIGVLGMVLFIVVIGKKIQMLLNFMIRIVLGGIGIIYANDFFTSQGIAISVGLNPVSLLTIGILGIGGFVVVFWIFGCKIFCIVFKKRLVF